MESVSSAIPYVHSWLRKVSPFLFFRGRRYTGCTWQGFGSREDAAAVISENRGLFHRQQGGSAPASWCILYLISDLGFASAISRFMPPLPIQYFLPFLRYTFLEVPQAWWMGSAVSWGGFIGESAVSGTEHAWSLLTEGTLQPTPCHGHPVLGRRSVGKEEWSSLKYLEHVQKNTRSRCASAKLPFLQKLGIRGQQIFLLATKLSIQQEAWKKNSIQNALCPSELSWLPSTSKHFRRSFMGQRHRNMDQPHQLSAFLETSQNSPPAGQAQVRHTQKVEGLRDNKS